MKRKTKIFFYETVNFDGKMKIMKHLFFIFMMIFILFGCTAKGKLKIINETNHNLFFSVENADYELAGAENSNPSKTIEIEIGKRFLFVGNDEKIVPLHLEGETFMMQLADNDGNPTGEYFTETNVLITAGKTTKVYTDPTHACVKLINDSERSITDFDYFVGDEDVIHPILSYALIAGDSIYQRLIPATEENQITYSFRFRFADDEDYQILPDSYSLFLDEEFRIYAADYKNEKFRK